MPDRKESPDMSVKTFSQMYKKYSFLLIIVECVITLGSSFPGLILLIWLVRRIYFWFKSKAA